MAVNNTLLHKTLTGLQTLGKVMHSFYKNKWGKWK